MVMVLMGLIDCFVTAPSQRGWALLAFAYYINILVRTAWEKLLLLINHHNYLRLVVMGMDASTLYNAITADIEAAAETAARISGVDVHGTRDMQACTDYDPATGKRVVKFTFWGVQDRSLRMMLHPPHNAVGTGQPASDSRQRAVALTVEYKYGERMICGRDSHLEQATMLTVWLRTSLTNMTADRQLLRLCCEQSLAKALEPPRDRVEIYTLHDSSADWVPEWHLQQTRLLKDTTHVGQDFYLRRDALNELTTDADLWIRRSLRIHLLTGPPGVGKTEFTVWLAGYLRVPIYRLSLINPSLTDARLIQLLSPNSMKHETVVVQIDEFHQVLDSWDKKDNRTLVTQGGFNDFLQGSSTLTTGLIIATGHESITREENARKYEGLFRRFETHTKLEYLKPEDGRLFFRNFLMQYVKGSTLQEWMAWEDAFLPHCPKRVPVSYR